MPRPQKNRLAIYARVSTSDDRQDPENQLAQLRQWATAGGYDIVAEYVEHDSGAKPGSERSAFRQMRQDASRRRFDLLLVWALDRLTREGMTQTVTYLQELARYGVAFHSYQEPTLSTDNELARDILLAVFASLAKAERERISNRTKAGLARARSQGKRLGRPSLPDRDKVALLALQDSGKSLRAIARETGIPYSSVRRHLRPDTKPTTS